MSLRTRWLPPILAVCAATSAFAASYIVPPDHILIGKADAIVTARATSSWVEESSDRGIETVTEFNVEEVLKGSVGHTFRVRIPGGKINGRSKIIPGAPGFANGDEHLLFLTSGVGDDYTTTDFGLGRFAFDYDDMGHRLALRDEGEIFGWDLETNEPHREMRRSAQKFIDYIRDVGSGSPKTPDYLVPKRPLMARTTGTTAHVPTTLACAFPSCTATSYMLSASGSQGGTESDIGFRWRTFPAAVNWNQGNNETGAPNGGTIAITGAFGSWNNDASSNVNYVLATANSNANGIAEDPDGVNNVVFEKNFGSPYSCGGGGLLGVGGIQNAYSGLCAQNQDPNTCRHTFNGESFASTIEADVSMNQGIANCTSLFNSGDFNSAVTHEVGHTLGFRHADRDRRSDNPCATQTNYECASSAIMTATVTAGLNGALQTWDQHAIQKIYASTGAPPAAPTNVVATAILSTSVQITWTASAGATSYQIWRRAAGGSFAQINTSGTSPYTDATASANAAYLYLVRAVSSGGTSGDSNYDLATTVIFTDDPLVANTTVVKAVHLSELRTAVTAVRLLAGVGAGSYTDAASAGTPIRAIHVTELRTQLDTARSALALSTGGYTDTSLGGVLIKAVHWTELRDRVK